MSEVIELAYSVEEYVEDMRKIRREETDEVNIIKRLEPLALKLAKSLASAPGWIKDSHYICDEEQGFGLHMLHEEEDHTNSVFLFSWLPNRGTPVHDHRTWGVVVGLDGEQTETFYKRLDDRSKAGFAELERTGEQKLTLDVVSSFLGNDVHRVWNTGDRTTLSLHSYGKHVNYTGRSKFFPEKNLEMDYHVTVEDE